jgi:DNA-binding response OmpR family regulator
MAKTRILCIDDDRPTVTIISGVLKKEGFEVETALDGSEGLKKARSLKPDLIILDIAMPKMDGFQVHRHLRENPETARIDVVMLTAKDGVDKIVELNVSSPSATDLRLGALEFMSKPVKAKDLIERVKAVLAATGVRA